MQQMIILQMHLSSFRICFRVLGFSNICEFAFNYILKWCYLFIGIVICCFIWYSLSIRIVISLYEMFEDNKRVITSRTSKKDRHYHCLKKNNKGTDTDLQNTKQKTKVRATPTLPKLEVKTGAKEGKAVPIPIVTSVLLLLFQARLSARNEEWFRLRLQPTEHFRGHL